MSENERLLEQVVSGAPSFLCVLSVPDYRYLKSNLEHQRLVRRSDVVGKSLAEVHPGLAEQGFIALLDETARTGKRTVRREVPVVYAAGGGEEARTVYLDLVYQPLFRESGEMHAIAVQGYEVTDRVLSQRAAANERENFRNLFRQTPEMVCITRGPEHVFELVNEAHVRTLGFDATGMSVRKAQPESVEVHGILDEVYRTGRTAELREIAVTVTDRLRYFNLTYAARRDEAGQINGIMILGVEITDQVQARESLRSNQAALAREYERAEFLADASDVLASSLDYHETLGKLGRLAVPVLADWCTVTVVGPGQDKVRVAAVHRDEAKSPLIADLASYYPVDSSDGTGIGWVARTGQTLFSPKVEDSALVTAARDERHLQIMRELSCRSSILAPIVARGRVLGVISLVRGTDSRPYDESDVSVAEELGRRAGISIDNALLYEAEQKAVRARDEFMSIASHELKTPLTSLRLQAQLRTRDVSRGQFGRFAPDRIPALLAADERQVNRLARLVDDMLDVSRVQLGKMSYSPEDFDLNELARDTLARLSAEVESSRSTVELIEGPPARGHWDKFRIEQVLVNLLTNAIKYGAGHPIRVEVSVAPDGSRASLSVTDHGIGIREEDQERVFGQFERAIPANDISGMGLGLYISRKIVEAHQGNLSVKSRPGSGSTFIVELPIAPR